MPSSGRSPLTGDLQAIRQELESTNPELYRQLALYLQVLREVLPRSVQQVCFHMATQVHPGRYLALSPLQRTRFHGRVVDLVDRCCCLLTVEQLTALAARLAREQARQRRLERSLPSPEHAVPNRDLPSGLSTDNGSASEVSPAPRLDDPPIAPSPGSVQLGLDLPIDGDWLGFGGSGQGFQEPWIPEPWRSGDDQDSAEDPNDEDAASTADLSGDHEALAEALGDFLSDALADDHGDGSEELSESHRDGVDERLWDGSNLFAALAEAAGMGDLFRGLQIPGDDPTAGGRLSSDGNPPAPPEPEGRAGLGSASSESPHDPSSSERSRSFRPGSLPVAIAAVAAGRWKESAAQDPAALFQPPPGGGLLPRDPILLLAWLDGVEQALARRLRNLSHALNVQLLQAGLSRVLLPMALLDAALAGQIEGLSPLPNLLQMPLPLAFEQGGSSLAGQAILLRCADLELEHPRLRTVRGRLLQRRQESRRMARHYHRLLRRLQAHEAEALWQQDIQQMRHDRKSPPQAT